MSKPASSLLDQVIEATVRAIMAGEWAKADDGILLMLAVDEFAEREDA